MTLPFDYARCEGEPEVDLCKDCRRREPGRPDWQAYITPIVWVIAGSVHCDYRIEPLPTTRGTA